MARLFVALEVPYQVKVHLTECVASLGRVGDFRWTKPSNYHLTLAFLGEADPEAVRVALSSNPVSGEAITLRTEAWGGFPRTSSARVLWAGIDGGGELLDLGSGVKSACRPMAPGMDSKPLYPHLTLGRAKTHTNLDGIALVIPSMSWRVDHYSLVESKLSPQGANYTVLAEFPI